MCVLAGIKQLEVSAQAMAAAAALAGRVALYGGAALIMDYGRDEPYPVRNHITIDTGRSCLAKPLLSLRHA